MGLGIFWFFVMWEPLAFFVEGAGGCEACGVVGLVACWGRGCGCVANTVRRYVGLGIVFCYVRTPGVLLWRGRRGLFNLAVVVG